MNGLDTVALFARLTNSVRRRAMAANLADDLAPQLRLAAELAGRSGYGPIAARGAAALDLLNATRAALAATIAAALPLNPDELAAALHSDQAIRLINRAADDLVAATATRPPESP